MSELFHGGIKIIKILKRANFDAYFVGGCVRDKLLDRDIHDIDIATSATPEQIVELFKVTIPVGIKHGTVMVKMNDAYYEVSTFKSNGNENPSILTDLAHRDFTMNALALTEDFELFDPYHFKTDIEHKIIRAAFDPFERFSEDPLRMLRAIRFASQLGFTLEEKTKKVISEYHEMFSEVAKERIVQEFEKLLLGNNVKRALQILIETNLYKEIAFLENEKMIESFCQLPIDELKTIEERWATLFYCSEKRCVPPIYMAKQQKKEIKTIVDRLGKIVNNSWTSFDVYQVGLAVAKKISRVQSVISGNRTITETELEQLYEQIPIRNQKELSVTGKDLINLLQIRPGSWLKSLLEQIEQNVVAGELNNHKDEILAYAVKVMKEREV